MDNKCLLIINTFSRSASKFVNNERFRQYLSRRFSAIIEWIWVDGYNKQDFEKKAIGCNAIVACGGDGTLNIIVNMIFEYNKSLELFYIPCGTQNDTGKNYKDKDNQKQSKMVDIGTINDKNFFYVAATGTFSDIGYLTNRKLKRVFSKMAYLLYALFKFKPYQIDASIEVDGDIVINGKFTLIMIIKSKFVMGSGFNRRFCDNDGKGQLLLINTPNGMFKQIKLFSRFVRTFIIGFDKNISTKNIIFLDCSSVDINTTSGVDFCIDGEYFKGGKNNKVLIEKQKLKLTVLDAKKILDF